MCAFKMLGTHHKTSKEISVTAVSTNYDWLEWGAERAPLMKTYIVHIYMYISITTLMIMNFMGHLLCDHDHKYKWNEYYCRRTSTLVHFMRPRFGTIALCLVYSTKIRYWKRWNWKCIHVSRNENGTPFADYLVVDHAQVCSLHY